MGKGTEDQGPEQGRVWSVHPQRNMPCDRARTHRNVGGGTESGGCREGSGGRTHLAEECAVWPSLHLHQDPLRRPCPKCQPQVPRHRHGHVISKVPSQRAVATEMVGMGHG